LLDFLSTADFCLTEASVVFAAPFLLQHPTAEADLDVFPALALEADPEPDPDAQHDFLFESVTATNSLADALYVNEVNLTSPSDPTSLREYETFPECSHTFPSMDASIEANLAAASADPESACFADLLQVFEQDAAADLSQCDCA